jgi:WD40 repeat protein
VVRVFGNPRFRHDSPLLALWHGPDGLAFSVEEGGVLRRWDVDTGNTHTVSPLGAPDTTWAFSGDGRLLASGSSDLGVWRVEPAGPMHRVRQPSWVTAVALDAKGHCIATGHEDGRVRLWDAATATLLGERQDTTSAISALAFDGQGEWLAAADEDRVIRTYRGRMMLPGQNLAGHTDRISMLAWQPFARTLASAGWDSMVRVWDVVTGEPLILLNAHAAQVHALSFSPDGHTLATADSDFIVRLWHFGAAYVRHELRGHDGEVTCLGFDPHGKRLLSGGRDRRLLMWDVGNGRNFSGRGETPPDAIQVAVSPDGKRVAMLQGGPSVQVFDVASGQRVYRTNHPYGVNAIAFSPDGHWLATGDAAGGVHLWRAEDGELEKTFQEHRTPVSALAFRSDGQILISAGGADGYVYIWSTGGEEPIVLIPEATDHCSAEAVAFVPGTPKIAAAGMDLLSSRGDAGLIALWDTDQWLPSFVSGDGATRIAVRPDGRQLVSNSTSGCALLWDLAERSLFKELPGHADAVTCVAYSPGGRIVATGSDDHHVCFWSSDTGALLSRINLQTQVKDLCFAPDGRHVFTANGNAACYMVQVPTWGRRG